MSAPQQRSSSSASLLLILMILGVFAFLYYRYNQGGGGGLFSEPEEYELTFRPADFRVDIDPELALSILQHPRRYRREFDQLVYDINVDILRHVTNRMGLRDSLRLAAVDEYDRQHPQFAELYYNDFMRLRDESAAVYETWYEEGGAKLTEVFEEVASNYTCFMVNKVLAAVLTTRGGSILAEGREVDNPCRIATAEALRPMMKRMAERAAIDDFSKSRGIFQEKVETVIGELATIEIRDKKGLEKVLNTNIAGFNISETDLEISAISILKVGFRLDQYFDLELDEARRVVRITLPEPVILSHEVLPKIEKLDIGWMRELESGNINQGVNTLREVFRAEALESDVMDKAKTQAQTLMTTMFQPLVRQLGEQYRIELAYYSPPTRETQGYLN